MSELKERVKDQLGQVNGSIEQITKAGRGLVVKISQTGSKQFEQLVKTGEAQEEDGKSLASQVRESFGGPLDDVKGSIGQIRLAALGLLTVAKENGGKYFNELVEIGQSKDHDTPVPKKSEAA